VATPVREITGAAGDLTVHFTDGETLTRQAVFHRAPTRQHSALAEQLGCEVLPDGTIKVDEMRQTTVPGVAAAGDMAKLPGLPAATTLVVLSAGDGVRAAVWMDGELFRSDLGITFPG
jgi:thioredoxin reductase